MTRRAAAIVVGLLLASLMIAGGRKVYHYLNFDRTPAYLASEPLFAAARSGRPLTADEFDRVLTLCDCGQRIVELRMFAAMAVAVEKSPDFKPKAVALFTRLAADPTDPQRQATAALQLKRLTDPPAVAP